MGEFLKSISDSTHILCLEWVCECFNLFMRLSQRKNHSNIVFNLEGSPIIHPVLSQGDSNQAVTGITFKKLIEFIFFYKLIHFYMNCEENSDFFVHYVLHN